MADLWIDSGVPKKTGQEKKGRERTRDKIIGFFAGAKGNQQKDVKDCRAHIQVYLYLHLYLYLTLYLYSNLYLYLH